MHGYPNEKQQLLALLDAARHGQGGAIVIEGEAGIGKSTLCRHLSGTAPDMTFLLASGTEAEAVIPFAGLFDLFSPLDDRWNDLPSVQAEALRGALALGPGEVDDRLTIAAATLNLLGGGQGPTLAIVDDAQWIDDSSIAALAFAARRLADRPTALILTRRPTTHTAGHLEGLPRLILNGLDQETAIELVLDVRRTCAAEVAAELWAQTGGNPLALTELATTLPQSVLAGTVPLPHVLPIGSRLAAVFGERLDGLDTDTRFALLLLATVRESRQEWTKTLEAAGMTFEVLESALTTGIIEIISGEPRFCHPLARSAVLDAANGSQQRRAEAILAKAFADDPDRRTWHLARAATGPDENLARQLMEVAVRSSRKTGYAEAALASLRARELSTSPATRLEASLAAARFRHATGRSRDAIPILREALTEASDPITRALVQEARAEIELWIGHPRNARDLLVAEAELIEPHDRVLAARLRAQASLPSVMIGDLRTARDLASLAFEVLGGEDGPLAVLATAALAEVLLLVGEREEGTRLAEQAFAGLADLSFHDRLLPLALLITHCLAIAECAEKATSSATRLITTARAQHALGLLPPPLTILADILARQGELTVALAHAKEALGISSELDHRNQMAQALVILARTKALLGQPGANRLATEALGVLRAEGASPLEAYAQHALGLSALGEGRIELAIRHLEEAARTTKRHGVGDDYIVPWAPDLVEALMRAGDAGRAAEIVEELAARVVRGGSRWGAATLDRCRGQLGGEQATEHFHQAIAGFREGGHPFDVARTQLAFGEYLRRTRRRREARIHLESAALALEHFGARPWAERARAELRATGGTARLPSNGVAELTPQEIRIALRVMNGDTNTEVAHALFLSPKTIENRLTTVYAKMGVRSRTQLARVLRESGITPDDSL